MTTYAVTVSLTGGQDLDYTRVTDIDCESRMLCLTDERGWKFLYPISRVLNVEAIPEED